MKWLILAGYAAIFNAQWGSDQHWLAWLLLVSFALFGLCICLIEDKVPVPPLLLVTYVLWNGLVVTSFKVGTMGANIDLAQSITIKELSAHAEIEFLILFIGIGAAFRQIRKNLEFAIVVLGSCEALSLLWDQLVLHHVSGEQNIGLVGLGNRSIGASFIAVWVPFVLHIGNKYWRGRAKEWLNSEFLAPNPVLFGASFIVMALTGVLAILVSSSGISFAAMIVGILPMIPWYYGLSIIGLGGAIAPFVKSGFYGHTTRYELWPIFWRFYSANFSPWFGSGLGTFKFWGPASEITANHLNDGYWLWAHSDWLQIYFELGVVGLGLALAAFIGGCFATLRRPRLLGSILALGVVMLGNYPLHVAPFALFVWYLGFEAYEQP